MKWGMVGWVCTFVNRDGEKVIFVVEINDSEDAEGRILERR